MKVLIKFICDTILIAIFISLPTLANQHDFICRLESNRNVYTLGQTPIISVSIKNNSPMNTYMLGSLLGSDYKLRSPYCYFEIVYIKNETIQILMNDQEYKSIASDGSIPVDSRTGESFELKISDFRYVETDELFNPYTQWIGGGYKFASDMLKSEHFKYVGKYIIVFYYSSLSTDLKDYFGDSTKIEVVKRFNQIPKVELESNKIEIEFVNP